MPVKTSVNFFAIFLATLILHGARCTAEEWEVHGRVLDEAGQPVEGATISFFWRGNGTRTHADGTPLDIEKNKDDALLFWQNEGQMEPFSKKYSGTSDTDGFFKSLVGNSTHVIMAMDRARKHGAIVTIPTGKENEPVEIRLGPLVKVHGKMIRMANDKPPFWSVADLCVPDNPERPLDTTRVAVCGTYAGHFELSLPPGQYFLSAYGNSDEAGSDSVGVQPTTKLDLTADKPDMDLGTLRAAPYLRPRERVEKAKADGTCFDYTKHYGEPPPAWHITDARGVNKDAKISDFKGKWVLLNFWGMSCGGCLGDELPKLMSFYEDHKAQRDQFEILALCIDYDGELKSLADVDRALRPIVKNVWGGKTLPFPVMLDPTFKTWETFGIDGLGTTILIDPQGRLIEGDEKTLAEKLK